jgi:hypothetical protein
MHVVYSLNFLGFRLESKSITIFSLAVINYYGLC